MFTKVSVRAPVSQRLLDSVDESPVMAYVKDLDGRYVHVNQRYQEFFAIGADGIRGRTDRDLAPRQTVDGPRRAAGSASEDDPLQLEYTVAPFEARPALAVWRFPVRAVGSDPVAVCGVAAPVVDAALARRECDRLIAIAQESDQAERQAVEEVDAPHADDSELTSERERRAGAEARAAEANAAALAERARADQSIAELNAARGELASVRGRLEVAEAAAQREAARAQEFDAATQRDRGRIEEALAELNAARGELASVRGRIEGVEAAAQRDAARVQDAEAALQRERARAEEALSELNVLRSELDAVRAELASEREQRTLSEQEVVDGLRRELADALAEADAARVRAEASSAELTDARDELAAARAELGSEHEQRTLRRQEVIDDLRQELERTAATGHHERVRADAAEGALNAERADAEVRVGVAERRIAELEAALSEARARELEQVATEHGAAGPHWDASAQRAFTTALSQSSDWRISVKNAIGVIGSRGGWDALCAWQPDDRNGFASCFAMWTGENRRLGALETATWQRRQPLEGSTIGEALTWEESQWLAADPRAADRRLQLLAQHGIRGALIVPVKDGARPVAALELLTVGATEPNRQLVDAIETIALQLGHFAHLLSAGAQPRWRFGRV